MAKTLDKSDLPCLRTADLNSADSGRRKALKFYVDQGLVRLAGAPISRVGGVADLKGPLAPDGAIAEIASMTDCPSFVHPLDGPRNRNLLMAELERRRNASMALPNNYQTSALRTFADQVGSALQRAVTLAGGKAEVVCYADI
jgi:hypothetical protein